MAPTAPLAPLVPLVPIVPSAPLAEPVDAAWQPPPEVTRYLEYVRVEKRLADRTCTLYSLDLARLIRMADQADVPLLALQPAHVRRFIAQMHAGGRSSRGIALILSGWRSFFTWAGRQGLVASNPVQGVRGPKASKPLPKALGVDDAVRLAEFQSTGADPWLEARDAAMVDAGNAHALPSGDEHRHVLDPPERAGRLGQLALPFGRLGQRGAIGAGQRGKRGLECGDRRERAHSTTKPAGGVRVMKCPFTPAGQLR